MATTRGGSVTIDVSARLQVLQNSVSEVQRVIDHLEPKSTRFKELSTTVAGIRREIERVQAQTARGFISPQQVGQTNKSLDKIDEAFGRIQVAVSRLNFKDLQLDPSQIKTLENFDKRLEQIQTTLAQTKQSIRDAFAADPQHKSLLDSIDLNAVNKDLKGMSTIVEKELTKQGRIYAKTSNELAELQQKMQIGLNVKEFLAKGKTGTKKDNTLSYSLETALGYDKWQQFFNNKNQFKTNQRTPFFEYVQSQFNLTPEQLNQIKQLSGPKIQELFADIIEQANTKGGTNWFQDQLDAATKASSSQQNVQTNVDNLQQRIANLRQLSQELATALLQQAAAEQKAAEDSDDVAGAQQRAADAMVANARAAGAGALSLNKYDQALESLREELAGTTVQLQRQAQAVNTINSIRSAITNFMGFNQVLNITRNAVREAANHIKQLDATMNGIAVVTKMTTADLWAQVDTYTEMAQRYGTSIQGAYEVSKIYYQAGYDTNSVLTLMNETLKMSRISGLDYADATDYMMTAMRGFKLEMTEASKVVDVYSALAASTAVSTQELAEAMTRTASSMESVGSSFEETSAMMATVIAVTRESANNIGSAFKSIASRYGEMKSDPAKLVDAEGEELAFNKVDAALKSVGITMKTTDGQFRSFTEVIQELAERWDRLSSVQQRYYLVA